MFSWISSKYFIKIADRTKPFPDKALLDVTDEMVRQNMTVLQMFHMGDEFFKSMNMSAVPE